MVGFLFLFPKKQVCQVDHCSMSNVTLLEPLCLLFISFYICLLFCYIYFGIQLINWWSYLSSVLICNYCGAGRSEDQFLCKEKPGYCLMAIINCNLHISRKSWFLCIYEGNCGLCNQTFELYTGRLLFFDFQSRWF